MSTTDQKAWDVGTFIRNDEYGHDYIVDVLASNSELGKLIGMLIQCGDDTALGTAVRKAACAYQPLLDAIERDERIARGEGAADSLISPWSLRIVVTVQWGCGCESQRIVLRRLRRDVDFSCRCAHRGAFQMTALARLRHLAFELHGVHEIDSAYPEALSEYRENIRESWLRQEIARIKRRIQQIDAMNIFASQEGWSRSVFRRERVKQERILHSRRDELARLQR